MEPKEVGLNENCVKEEGAMSAEEMMQECAHENWDGYVTDMASPENVVRWTVSGEFPVPVSYPEMREIMYHIICREEGWDDLDHVPRGVQDAVCDRVYDMLTELGLTRASCETLGMYVDDEREGRGSWRQVKRKKYLFTCPSCGPEYSVVHVFCRVGNHDEYLDVDGSGRIKETLYQAHCVGRERSMYIYWFHCAICGARWSPAATEEEFRAYYRLLDRPWPYGDED